MMYYTVYKMGTNTSGKKKIGLALSGGGWRGIAHIGVLKSLEKHGIPIDYITGTSIGALVGGLYSYFGNAEDLEKFFLSFGYRDLFKTTADPKLRNGLLNGKKIEKYLNQLTNNAMIEDLKIPYCAVASDLLTGESHYITKGSLSEAIRTSISIPLVFQPVKKDGMCLIDGGASENVPVRCVKRMGADIVIGVYVNSAFFPVKEDEVNTSAKIAVVSARVTLNKMSESLLSEADIHIKPRVQKKNSDIGLGYFLKFVKEKDLIKTGEEATEVLISQIRDRLK